MSLNVHRIYLWNMIPHMTDLMCIALPERGAFAEAGRKSIPAAHKAAVAALRRNYLQKCLNAAIEIYKVSCRSEDVPLHAAH